MEEGKEGKEKEDGGEIQQHSFPICSCQLENPVKSSFRSLPLGNLNPPFTDR